MTSIALPSSPAAHGESPERSQAFVCLSKLPPFHPTALKLMNISNESESAMLDFEDVFKSDPALTADLLLVANSAQFGLRARIDTIRHALAFLGLERVRALGCTIAFSFYVRNVPRADCLKAMWAHSIATAVVAEIVGVRFGRQTLYTAGLTHDLGRLAMFLSFGKEYGEVFSREFATIGESIEAENAAWGLTHGEAGDYVSQEWHFPENLRTCISNHHDPIEGSPGDPANLVRFACQMADYLGFAEVQRLDLDQPPAMPEGLGNLPEMDSEKLREKIQKRVDAFDTRIVPPRGR